MGSKDWDLVHDDLQRQLDSIHEYLNEHHTQERRCESIWRGGVITERVRCDRWAGHAGEHRGHDVEGMAYRWPDELVEDRRLRQENRVSEETLKSFETNQVQELEKLVQQWKDRCLKAEQTRDAHYRSWRHAVQQRDEARHEREELEAGGDLPLTRARIEELQGELLDARSELEARRQQVAKMGDLIRTLRDEVHMHRSRAEA